MFIIYTKENTVLLYRKKNTLHKLFFILMDH